MPAANLLVGSTCGSVYIIRCDPEQRTASVKTTISGGAQPFSISIDVETRSFYCLDRRVGEPEGRLLTLGPTEFGSIEQKSSIGTGAPRPFNMISVGRSIYVCHESSYTTFSFPKVAKSTRRRRASALSPVAEDSVAETLNDLYAISKTMDSGSPTKVPTNTIDLISQQLLDSSTQMDAVGIVQQVKTTDAVLKFVKRDDERYIYGITKREIGAYLVMTDGSLIKKQSKGIEGVIDCDSDGTHCYVLCQNSVKRVSMVSGSVLKVTAEYQINHQTGRAITVDKLHGRAYITAEKTLLSLDLKTDTHDVLEIEADWLGMSNDGRFLYVCKNQENKIEMYSNKGTFLASCEVEGPAEVIHMSQG